jgi:hypothetical protein
MTTSTLVKNINARQPFHWRIFWTLLALIAFGLLALLPYSLTVAGMEISAVLIPQLVVQFLVQLGLYALLAGLGIRMWGRTRLGAPLLERKSLDTKWKPVWLGLGIGFACGLIVMLLDVFLFAPRLVVELAAQPAAPVPPVWQGFLSAFYGGIVEEVIMRLFMITLLTWLGTRLFRGGAGHPNAVILWVAILVSGLALGIGHLPAAVALGIPLTPLYITRTFVLNGIGIVFGWLYWRRGLESAMAAHFAADIALHVIGILFLG